ncbi:MAG: TetR/AcrR family transcriptional regulator [Clostridiales bacterium]|nr:TetR/AcrR family transcriptional regulator [Clostridiales bacterium]
MPRSREQCEQIRESSKKNILDKSILYFAKNGLDGTKISDLVKAIGVGQGSIYCYFASKEELFSEVQKVSMKNVGLEEFDMINSKDLPPIRKLRYVSDYVVKNLSQSEMYCAYVYLAFYARMHGEKEEENPFFDMIKKIVSQGQKEGFFSKGNADKIADYYLGVIYLYAMRKLYDPKIDIPSSSELERVVRG